MAKPLKLLIVTGIYPPDPGGPAKFVPRISAALQSSGWQVTIITLSDVKDHESDQLGQRVIRVPRNTNRILRTLHLICALLRHGHSADIWLVQGLPFISSITAKLLGKPQIHKIVGDRAWEMATLRGWYTDTIDAFQTERGSLKIALAKQLRTIPLRWAHLVIVPSQYLGCIVATWGVPQEKIHVIYNAVDMAENLRSVASPGRIAAPKMVTVCRLVPWKGVQGILEALATLPEARLTVVGDGPFRQTLENEAARLDVADRVTWTGNIENSAVAAMLARHDIFVLNSTYEGLPHVVLEAFAQRIPVIATRAGGTLELVSDGETGLLIALGDSKALAQRIKELCDRPELRHALVAHARDALDRRFGFSTMRNEYEEILREHVRERLP